MEADEIRVRFQKHLVVWLAMGVPTRLWLGGVVSPKRDKALGRALADKVKACCRWGSLLVVTDSWIAYREAFGWLCASAIAVVHCLCPGRTSCWHGR